MSSEIKSNSSNGEVKCGGKIGEESTKKRRKISDEELKHLIHFVAECARKQPDGLVFNEVYRSCVPYMKEKFGVELTRTETAYLKILQKCFKTLEISLEGIEQEDIAAILYATRWRVHEELEIGLKSDFDIELDKDRKLKFYASKTDASIQVGHRNTSRHSKVRCIDEPNIDLINFVGERAKKCLKKWKLKEAVRSYLKSIDEQFDDKTLGLKVDKIIAMILRNPERAADVDREKIAAILYAMDWPVCEKYEKEFKKIAHFELEKETRSLLYYTSKNPKGWNTRFQNTDVKHHGSTKVPKKYKNKFRIKKEQYVKSDKEKSESEEEEANDIGMEEDSDGNNVDMEDHTLDANSRGMSPRNQRPRGHSHDDFDPSIDDFNPGRWSPIRERGSLRDNFDYDEAYRRSPTQRKMSTQEKTPIPYQTEEVTNGYNLLLNIEDTVKVMSRGLLEESLTMLGDAIEFCPVEGNVEISKVAAVVNYAAISMEGSITKDPDDTVALQEVHLLLSRIVRQVNSPKLDIIADHLRQLSIEKHHLGYRVPKKEFTAMIGKLIQYITKSEDHS